MQPKQGTLAPSQRMRIAYLLAFVGGYLDAYTYRVRGGVFANTQTGNVVKLGIALADGRAEACLTYLLPIGVFVAGLFVTLHIEELLTLRKLRLVRRVVLTLEMCVLAIVGLIPLGQEWDLLANSLVSFVAAMQYESFTMFHGNAIATTMTTGNLRKFVDCLFRGTIHQEPKELARAGKFLIVIVAFFAGALVSSRVSNSMKAEAVMPAIAVLGLTIVIITVLHHFPKSE